MTLRHPVHSSVHSCHSRNNIAPFLPAKTALSLCKRTLLLRNRALSFSLSRSMSQNGRDCTRPNKSTFLNQINISMPKVFIFLFFSLCFPPRQRSVVFAFSPPQMSNISAKKYPHLFKRPMYFSFFLALSPTTVETTRILAGDHHRLL